MPTYTRSPYRVAVSDDGSIFVRPGDMLSKYSWAIYGNYTTLNVFCRLSNGSPIPIVNKDLIYAGETLIHMPDYKPGNGKGGAPGSGAPRNGNGNGGGQAGPGNGNGTGNGQPAPGKQPAPGQQPAPGKEPDHPGFTGQIYKLTGGLAADLNKAPIEVGYLAYRVEYNVNFQVNETNPSGATLSEKDLGAQWEHKFSDDLKFTLSSKLLVFSSLEPAVRSNNQQLFANGLGNQFQMYFTYNVMTWGDHVAWRVQGGFVANMTPLRVAAQVQYKVEFPVNGVKVTGTVTGTFAFYIGLSKAGWEEMVVRVGREAVKIFTEEVAAELAEALIEAGIIGAAIFGSLLVFYLATWDYNNQLKAKEAAAYKTWYVAGYVQKVFGEGSPTGYNATPNPGLCLQLIQLGEKDALNEAKTTLIELGNPKANASEFAMLYEYRRLLALEAGSEANARSQMQIELRQKYDIHF